MISVVASELIQNARNSMNAERGERPNTAWRFLAPLPLDKFGPEYKKGEKLPEDAIFSDGCFIPGKEGDTGVAGAPGRWSHCENVQGGCE
jgi:hypothetical protein